MASGRTRLYQTIYEEIRSEITSGRLSPGDRIPTEQELMASYGVSRVTTTRALQMLQSDRLIVRKPGLGSFVAEAGEGGGGPLPAPPLRPLPDTRRESSRFLGFVVPYLRYTFGPRLLAALEEVASRQGFALGLACSYGSQQQEEEAISRLVALGAVGLVIFPVNGEYYNLALLRLHLDHFPIALVDKQLPGIPLPTVTSNNQESAAALTRHLLALGHRRIAYFSPNPDHTSTLQERFSGFHETLAGAGIRLPDDYILQPERWEYDEPIRNQHQIDVLMTFMRDHPEITAAFASDDQLAEAWLEAVYGLGKRVPDDFSIVCFDGPPVRPRFWNWTSALQDQGGLAAAAFSLIQRQLNHDHDLPPSTVVPTEIHLGQSSGPAPGALRTPGDRDRIQDA